MIITTAQYARSTFFSNIRSYTYVQLKVKRRAKVTDEENVSTNKSLYNKYIKFIHNLLKFNTSYSIIPRFTDPTDGVEYKILHRVQQDTRKRDLVDT